MEEVLQSFLAFSRPLSPLSQQEVDLKDLCASVLALHEGMAHGKNVSLELSAATPVSASCDSRKVKQILINLVQNALEASPSGATIELALLPGPKAGARVEVRDRGPGIAPDVSAYLFQPWPGNVRELENALESAVALSPDGTIDLAFLPDPAGSPPPQPAPTKFKEQVAAYERGLIVAALDAAKGNQSEAARLLDMGRAMLQDKMRKYALGRGEDAESD
jgi:hypothetical protein